MHPLGFRVFEIEIENSNLQMEMGLIPEMSIILEMSIISELGLATLYTGSSSELPPARTDTRAPSQDRSSSEPHLA